MASLVAMSTPSNVEFVVMAPVIAPPAFGKAAPAVVVVEVKMASLVAISIPSTVPPITKFPDISAAPFMSKLVPSNSVPVTLPVEVIGPLKFLFSDMLVYIFNMLLLWIDPLLERELLVCNFEYHFYF